VKYIARLTSATGGELARGGQGWVIASEIVRYRFEMQTQGASKLKARNVAAIEAFLTDPLMSFEKLARDLNTTEKQLAKISLLTLAHRRARLMGDKIP